MTARYINLHFTYLLTYLLNVQLATSQMVHLPSCQLHISVNRTAQIYLELHFCVELHTKKALLQNVPPLV